jgi:hypothetical protein
MFIEQMNEILRLFCVCGSTDPPILHLFYLFVNDHPHRALILSQL